MVADERRWVKWCWRHLIHRLSKIWRMTLVLVGVQMRMRPVGPRLWPVVAVMLVSSSAAIVATTTASVYVVVATTIRTAGRAVGLIGSRLCRG